MVRRIAILGSTGSIGRNALRVIEGLGEGYSVFALSANSKVELLAEQARAFGAKVVAITDASCRARLVDLLGDLDVEILSGPESLAVLAELDEVDTVVTAIVGAAGLPAVLAAAKKGKRLAIANKEPLVVAGELLMAEAARSGSEIMPVDSEHSAIFQAMQAGKRSEVARIILTASGGPFRNLSAEEIEPQQRLILQLVAAGGGLDGLRGIADFFAAEVDMPPFLGNLGKGRGAAQRDGLRRAAEMALEQQAVHQAPEKHDGNADGSLHKHALEYIW